MTLNALCMFVRASDDLNTHMVAVETMEQFQKELDQGLVSNTTQSVQYISFSLPE